MTLLGLAPGSWAEWVGGVGTALAFGATSVAIWQSHRLRRTEHAEVMYDEALKVTASVGMGAEYVDVPQPDGTIERKPEGKIVVTVHNGGRRQIRNVNVSATTWNGRPIGDGSVDFVQAGFDQPFSFDQVDGSYAPFGSTSSMTPLWYLAFEDIDETLWKRDTGGLLLRFRRLGRLRSRKGQRHAKNPRTLP
jgi:hypothetical protein